MTPCCRSVKLSQRCCAMEFIDKMMLLWYIEIDFLCIEGVALKKNFIIILTLFFLALLSLYGMAHGGGTDEDGGHVDKSTGEYHYHHGYPAHQHPDGECPYDEEHTAERDCGLEGCTEERPHDGHVLKPDSPETTEDDDEDDDDRDKDRDERDSEEDHDDYDDYDYDGREEKSIGKQIIEGICTVIMVVLIGWYIIGVIVEIYEDLKK